MTQIYKSSMTRISFTPNLPKRLNLKERRTKWNRRKKK